MSIVADHLYPFMTWGYNPLTTSQSSGHVKYVSWTGQWIQDLHPIEHLWGVVEPEIGITDVQKAAWCYHVYMDWRNVPSVLLNLCQEESRQSWRRKGVQEQYEHDVPRKVSGECIYSSCREICFHSSVIKLIALHLVFKALKEKLLRNYIQMSIWNPCLSGSRKQTSPYLVSPKLNHKLQRSSLDEKQH